MSSASVNTLPVSAGGASVPRSVGEHAQALVLAGPTVSSGTVAPNGMATAGYPNDSVVCGSLTGWTAAEGVWWCSCLATTMVLTIVPGSAFSSSVIGLGLET